MISLSIGVVIGSLNNYQVHSLPAWKDECLLHLCWCLLATALLLVRCFFGLTGQDVVEPQVGGIRTTLRSVVEFCGMLRVRPSGIEGRSVQNEPNQSSQRMWRRQR